MLKIIVKTIIMMNKIMKQSNNKIILKMRIINININRNKNNNINKINIINKKMNIIKINMIVIKIKIRIIR